MGGIGQDCEWWQGQIAVAGVTHLYFTGLDKGRSSTVTSGHKLDNC